MTSTATTAKWHITPAFDAYAKALIVSQRALMVGDEQTADKACEDMERVYGYLSEVERQRLSSLSADLYALTDEEVYDHAFISDEEVKHLIEEAFKAHDGETILYLLRKCRPDINKWNVLHLRGIAYNLVDYPVAAAEFLRAVVDYLPNDGQETAYFLVTLSKIRGDVNRECQRRAREAVVRFLYSPDLVVNAANALYSSFLLDLPTDRKELRDTSRYVAELIEPRIALVSQDLRDVKDMGYGMLVEALFQIGEYTKAEKHASDYIAAFPTRAAAWFIRGRLRYGVIQRQQVDSLDLADLMNSGDSVYQDFLRAVELGCIVPFAYMFVIFSLFEQHDYRTCLRISRLLSKLETANSIAQSVGFEFMARSSLALKHKRSEVSKYFKSAIAAHPERIELQRAYAEFRTDSVRPLRSPAFDRNRVRDMFAKFASPQYHDGEVTTFTPELRVPSPA